ncbi:hypothetical protein C9374_007616 [Naegleria lovaniensis]|uniref:Transmembrane protein n=1 Tax=Naegleria lovaniensis TaxID=51637 RepID=A0AA88GI23_NAELO|nr:uncharacterized protein C9374_007616 [Naegleria lovaniensis]KAG2378978.1 hypothetical protein C9374_007616 [Naegleria lovaniensis]
MLCLNCCCQFFVEKSSLIVIVLTILFLSSLSSVFALSPPIVSPPPSSIFNTPIQINITCQDPNTFIIIQTEEEGLNITNYTQNTTSFINLGFVMSNISFSCSCSDPFNHTSEMLQVRYHIHLRSPQPPRFDPKGHDSQSYQGPLSLSMSNPEVIPPDQSISQEIWYTFSTSQVNPQFLKYDPSTPIMLTSGTTYIVRAKTKWSYFDASLNLLFSDQEYGREPLIVLESSIVSEKYIVMPQCSYPVPSIAPGVYWEEVLNVNFSRMHWSGMNNLSLHVKLDQQDFQNWQFSNSIQLWNDGKNHTIQAFVNGSACSQSELFHGIYVFKKPLPQPIFIPPNSPDGFLQGTILSISCPSNFTLTLNVSRSNSQHLTTQSQSFQRVSSPFLLRLNESMNIGALCEEDELDNLSSAFPTTSVLSYFYQVYSIARPVLSQSSKTNVGPMNLSISCSALDSAPCGILYTLDESISLLSNSMKKGVIFSNQSIVNVTLSNYGLNTLKVVAMDLNSGIISPQVEEKLAADIRIESLSSDGILTSILTSSKISPFTLTLETNTSVFMNFSKLHHVPSKEFSFRIHVLRLPKKNIQLFPSLQIPISSSLQQTLYTVEIVLLVLSLTGLSLLIAIIIVCIIVRKRKEKLHQQMVAKYDLQFERMDRQQFQFSSFEGVDDVFSDDEEANHGGMEMFTPNQQQQ